MHDLCFTLVLARLRLATLALPGLWVPYSPRAHPAGRQHYIELEPATLDGGPMV